MDIKKHVANFYIGYCVCTDLSIRQYTYTHTTYDELCMYVCLYLCDALNCLLAFVNAASLLGSVKPSKRMKIWMTFMMRYKVHVLYILIIGYLQKLQE